MAKQYKVIFIDWDGTLSNSRFWQRWIGTSEYDRIQQVLFGEDTEHTRLWMTGFMTYNQVLRHVESNTGIAYEELASELEYSARHMKYIDGTTIDLIQKLRKNGIKVVIATDNMETFRLWTVPELKLENLFDGILTSDTRGALKTEYSDNGTSKFFSHYLTQSDIHAGESVLIDNSLDIKIVENFGIDFLHVNESTSLVDHLKRLLD